MLEYERVVRNCCRTSPPANFQNPLPAGLFGRSVSWKAGRAWWFAPSEARPAPCGGAGFRFLTLDIVGGCVVRSSFSPQFFFGDRERTLDICGSPGQDVIKIGALHNGEVLGVRVLSPGYQRDARDLVKAPLQQVGCELRGFAVLDQLRHAF